MIPLIISTFIFMVLFILLSCLHSRKNFNTDSLSFTILKFVLLIIMLASLVVAIISLFTLGV